MSRAELMKQIAELDRQIHEASAKTKLPSLNMRHAQFPTSLWVSTLIISGVWAFGGQIPVLGPFVIEYGFYIFIFAALVAVYTLFRTGLWVVKRNAKPDANYRKATEKIRELQQKRAALQEKLKNAKE